MSDHEYDIAVIGAGPGGYVCAIRAAQLGMKTALIDKREELGGTCLNVGCIPSKALLYSSEVYHSVAAHGSAHGIKSGKISPDVDSLMQEKDKAVKKLVGGVRQLTTQRGIEVYQGEASLAAEGRVQVKGKERDEELRAKHIVLATGSVPASLPTLPFDGERIVSSDEAIAFDEVPNKMIVVGGGAIGLELGSVWGRMGSDVQVFEYLDQIAPFCDQDIAKLLARSLKKQGVMCHTGAEVQEVETLKTKLKAKVKMKGETHTYDADKILVCVGRRPCTDQLNLEAVGLKTDGKGRIPVKNGFQTEVDGIYAIGDVIEGPMLAHKAEEEGVALAELLAGQAGHVHYEAIPNVIYTAPEVAVVGLRESEAQNKGHSVKTGKFPLAANGRAIASQATDGLVKVVADAETDRLLGVQIMSHHASEVISSAVTHLEYCGSAEDVARTITAHPTMGESLKEAAMAVHGRALHSL